MKKYSLPFVFLFIVLFASFAAAVQPSVVTQVETGRLDIVYPKNPAYQQGENFALHFHVFNSTGFLMKSPNVNCLIHIYNFSNNHILQKNLTMDSNNIDFNIDLNSTFSSIIGSYPYIVQCNATNEGGFISTTYEVTSDGLIHIENSNSLTFMIYLIGTIIILFWFGSMLQEDNEWQQGIKLLLNLIGLAMLIIGAGFMLVNMQAMNVAQSNYSIMSLLYWILLVVLLFLIILFLVIFIFKLINYMRKLKTPEF